MITAEIVEASEPFTPTTPSAGGRVELVGIQMLRGIAAALVVFHHSLEE